MRQRVEEEQLERDREFVFDRVRVTEPLVVMLIDTLGVELIEGQGELVKDTDGVGVRVELGHPEKDTVMVPDIDLHVLTVRVPLMVLDTVKETLWVKDRVTLEHPDELPEALVQNESEGEPDGEPEGDAEKDPTDKRLGRGLMRLSPPT